MQIISPKSYDVFHFFLPLITSFYNFLERPLVNSRFYSRFPVQLHTTPCLCAPGTPSFRCLCGLWRKKVACFMKKVRKLFCQFAELSYLCTRFRKNFGGERKKKRSLTYCKQQQGSVPYWKTYGMSSKIRQFRYTMNSLKSGSAWDKTDNYYFSSVRDATPYYIIYIGKCGSRI